MVALWKISDLSQTLLKITDQWQIQTKYIMLREVQILSASSAWFPCCWLAYDYFKQATHVVRPVQNCHVFNSNTVLLRSYVQPMLPVTAWTHWVHSSTAVRLRYGLGFSSVYSGRHSRPQKFTYKCRKFSVQRLVLCVTMIEILQLNTPCYALLNLWS